MSAAEKTVSSYIRSQLPDFIKSDHPKFKRFLELYYQWLEQNNPSGVSNTAGNTIYHAMQIGDYRDIDETPSEFLRYFKEELVPFVPENARLDLRKILKTAREFYNKKGSEESVKWLFKVLFNENIEINYPKEQILIASDGKWKKPRAFRITSSELNKNIDVNLLEKRLGIGSVSGATCFIESANRTTDVNSGREIIEIYISNIKRYFENGEFLVINYVDSDGSNKVFSEKIIGTLSNLRINPNRQGLLYNVGDPVVITGGLAETAEAEDAIGIVGNVTTGSIESVSVIFPGYGYLAYPPNTEITVLRSAGDDPDANASTDLRVQALNLTACTSNSQRNFLETIEYDASVIDYVKDVVLSSANIAAFTSNNRNTVLNVTENDSGDDFDNYEQVWADGASYATANFTAKIATANGGAGGPFGAGGSAYTGGILLYDIANTGTLATILSGEQIYTKNTNKSFVFNSITTYLVPANVNSKLIQCADIREAETGGVALVSVVNGGAGFRSEPQLEVVSHYDTQLSENYDYLDSNEIDDKRDTWQTFIDLGKVAHVYINNPGSGYTAGDTISFVGRGYGGNAVVDTVSGTGGITSISIVDRGEGHLVRPTCVISTSGGSGAILTAYLIGDGFEYVVGEGDIGRIRDLRLVYRGYDYVETPNVSLKVVDTVINEIAEAENYVEQEYVYQGASFSTSTFRANVKSYSRTTGVLRLYNYSGSIDSTLPIISANGVTTTVNTSQRVPAPAQYDAEIIASKLPNPMFYGNGRARANALFANGLIEFNGFYLNTDGFPSSDKRLQDDNIYHNFSYIIQSEKTLSEFEIPLKNIIHPAGLKVLSKSVLKSTSNNQAKVSSNVDYIKPIATSSTVTVPNSFFTLIQGTGTLFTSSTYQANVGDLFFILDTVSPLRTQSKIIASVNGDEELLIEGDFIYVGQGKLTTNSDAANTGCTAVEISANTNAVSDFIRDGDFLRVNITNAKIVGTVNVSGTTVTGNTTGANTTYFVGNVIVGSQINVNNEIRTVVTVGGAGSLTVNLAFNAAATNKYLYANTVFLKQITANSGTSLTLNTAIFTTKSNLIYQIVPTYTNYGYKIVTLTADG